MSTLPTNRTAGNSLAEHLADHNALAALNNVFDAKGDLVVGTADDVAARLAVGTNGKALQADSATATGLRWAGADQIATFSFSGTLTTGTGTGRFLFPFAATILGVSAAVGTAPTGASAISDVNKNGTTIFTSQGNRPTIAISGNATSAETTPDVTAMAAGDYLTVDRDQVGSTIAGADLTVFVRYRQT